MRTKELADVHRKLAENAGPVLAARCLEVAALLDRLHAIESASGEEVAAIRERHDARQAGEEPADYSQAFEDAHEDRATLLAIVQRQGAAESSQRAEIAELSKALDCARAEIRRQVGEVDNLKTANAALAAENARLVNEVGALAVEPIPIEETHAEYIARLRKDVEDRRRDLEEAQLWASLYDHEQEMLEYAELELAEALESEPESQSTKPEPAGVPRWRRELELQQRAKETP